MSTAYLGLGGNLGDRSWYLAEAVRRLHRAPGIRVERTSSVYETKPVGVTNQPDFLNLVAQVTAEIGPRDLLACCLQIESDLGRVRTQRWGPRTVDLDVLWYDGQIVNEPDLVLPHPRLHERAFVLVPLVEIAPELSLAGGLVSVLAARSDRTGLRLLGPLAWLPE